MSDNLQVLSSYLENMLLSELHSSKFPSLSLGVFLCDQPLLFKGCGFIDVKTQTVPSVKSLFRCASLTKAFTCIMMLQLRDKRLLSLDDPISLHLKDVMPSDSKFLEKFDSVTLRSLAGQCSGLPREGDFDRWDGSEMVGTYEEILSRLTIEKLALPFDRYHYSNVGYILLGTILEKIAKRPYAEYVTEEILKPLGMVNSTFEYNQEKNKEFEAKGYLQPGNETKEAPTVGYGACKPCGGLLTSIEDFSKFVTFLMKNNQPNVLKSNLELMSPVVMMKPQKNQNKLKARAYGLGIQIGDYNDEYKVFSHSGGTWGFASYWITIPELKLGVIIWYNSDKSALRSVIDKTLDVVIPALKVKKIPESISIPSPEEKKVEEIVKLRQVYQHKMGDKIRLRLGKNMSIDVKEANGDKEKKVKLEKIEENKYKITSGGDVDEVLEFIGQKTERLPEIIKLRAGLYHFSENPY